MPKPPRGPPLRVFTPSPAHSRGTQAPSTPQAGHMEVGPSPFTASALWFLNDPSPAAPPPSLTPEGQVQEADVPQGVPARGDSGEAATRGTLGQQPPQPSPTPSMFSGQDSTLRKVSPPLISLSFPLTLKQNKTLQMGFWPADFAVPFCPSVCLRREHL